MSATAPPPLLRMRGVEKRFRGVDFGPHAGGVHALSGENGAGKSTLMDVLSGVVPPDRGTMEPDGKPVAFADPRDAQAAGIATMFQELDPVPGPSVAANLFLGREPTRPGRPDERRMARDAPALLARVGAAGLDPRRRVAGLGMGQRRLVAIAEALAHAPPRVPVMDEPTRSVDVDAKGKSYGRPRRWTRRARSWSSARRRCRRP